MCKIMEKKKKLSFPMNTVLYYFTTFLDYCKFLCTFSYFFVLYRLPIIICVKLKFVSMLSVEKMAAEVAAKIIDRQWIF